MSEGRALLVAENVVVAAAVVCINSEEQQNWVYSTLYIHTTCLNSIMYVRMCWIGLLAHNEEVGGR